MTQMTDDAPTPPPMPPPAPAARQLRRSTTDRVGAGVCGGLGEYFGLDPVIFRVLFATSAFFGIGVVAYLLAWVVVPDAGATNPPLDRFISELRRRHVPLWLVITVGLLVAWAGFASWWSPRPLIPLALAAIVLVVAFTRSRRGSSNATPPPAPVGFPADPSSTEPLAAPVGWEAPATPPTPPTTRSELGAWIAETRAARRERRQRNLPIRIATWSVWLIALVTVSVIDAIHRISIPVYLWTSLVIIVISVLVGAILRRRVFGYSPAVIPLAFLLFAFGGTSASFHDGAGDYSYNPTSASELQSHYRTAFGRTTLDLTDLGSLTQERSIRITQAAGQVRILVPSTLNVDVHSAIHAGSLELDGQDNRGGVNYTRNTQSGPGGTSPTLNIDVELAAGQVEIDHAS